MNAVLPIKGKNKRLDFSIKIKCQPQDYMQIASSNVCSTGAHVKILLTFNNSGTESFLRASKERRYVLQAGGTVIRILLQRTPSFLCTADAAPESNLENAVSPCWVLGVRWTSSHILNAAHFLKKYPICYQKRNWKILSVSEWIFEKKKKRIWILLLKENCYDFF